MLIIRAQGSNPRGNMKKTNMWMLGSLLALGLAGTARALPSRDGMRTENLGGGEKMGTSLLDGIVLTPAQKILFKGIREEYMPQIVLSYKKTQTTGAEPVGAEKAQLTALHAQYMAATRMILTAEQQVVFDQNVLKMAPGR